MGRRRRSTLDDLAAMPWPVGLAVGIVAFAVVRYGVPLWFARQDGPLAQAFATQPDFLAPFAWLALALCSIGAAASFLKSRHSRKLLDTRTNLESLAAMGWRDFERLVGEAFRREGYAVEETGLGGADGGIDLILCRDGRRTLVQCKQWRREKVPVNVVREMYGLLGHHGADEVRIATVGGYTPDAERFAAGKPIELIDGTQLLAMVRRAQASDPRRIESTPKANSSFDQTPASSTLPPAPACPRCGAAMIQRTNRQTNSLFWGCPAFPTCRGTR